MSVRLLGFQKTQTVRLTDPSFGHALIFDGDEVYHFASLAENNLCMRVAIGTRGERLNDGSRPVIMSLQPTAVGNVVEPGARQFVFPHEESTASDRSARCGDRRRRAWGTDRSQLSRPVSSQGARYRRGCFTRPLDSRSHNIPGLPRGIAGTALLGELREQAVRYGAEIRPGHDAIERLERGFRIRLAIERRVFCARIPTASH
jgi:hypothetical protein